MEEMNRELTVLADGGLFAPGTRFRLSGKTAIGLYPSLFTLQAWNLSDPDVFRLMNTRELSVLQGDSCLAFGMISDVFRQTVPEGTITTAAFSLGLNLWEAPVSLSVEAGVPVSETVRRILAASGTGIPLLSFPGPDPVYSRGQAWYGRAAECITEALSRAGQPADAGRTAGCAACAVCARPYLVPAGLCVIPAEPLPATLHLTGKDLTDQPMIADHGKKLILSTTVTGFQPGEEMSLEYGGQHYAGLILERLVEADSISGPWRSQLLVQLR